MAKWIVNLCLNGWVLLRGFLRGVLLFMFYKKFAAVVLSAVLVGVVPSVVFADVDDISAVSDGDVGADVETHHFGIDDQPAAQNHARIVELADALVDRGA